MKRHLYMPFFVTLICAMMLGGAATAWAAEATPTTSLVILNGNTLPCAAYNIGGNNYFKLRDMMQALNVSVAYDAASNSIHLNTARSYTPDGSESSRAASAAANASPATVNVTVDGASVSWTAYNIGGSNYFKLRDMMQALDVYVYYSTEFNAIYLDTTKGYVAETPAATAPLPPAAAISGNGSGTLSASPITSKVLDGSDLAREDFSQQANPAVFDTVYTRTAYNAIRQSILDRDIITPGNEDNGINPYYHYAHAVLSEASTSAINNVQGRIGMYYLYLMKAEPYSTGKYNYPGYFICAPTKPAVFTEANAATAEIIREARSLTTDAEKVKLLNDYLCEKMTYDTEGATSLNTIFTSNTPSPGSCSTYANTFQYLCDQAGIPSIIISGENHAWNMVYADGAWLYVDVSINGQVPTRDILLLSATSRKTDENPQTTAFAQELLMPGSTK